jgi:hypothetical protein
MKLHPAIEAANNETVVMANESGEENDNVAWLAKCKSAKKKKIAKSYSRK